MESLSTESIAQPDPTLIQLSISLEITWKECSKISSI